MKQQHRNKRNNKMLCYNNKNKCLSEWEEETKLPIGSRLNSGWSLEKAMNTPLVTKFLKGEYK